VHSFPGSAAAPLIQKGASPAQIYLAANAAVCNAKANPADGYVL
jgi:hypothetical protein